MASIWVVFVLTILVIFQASTSARVVLLSTENLNENDQTILHAGSAAESPVSVGENKNFIYGGVGGFAGVGGYAGGIGLPLVGGYAGGIGLPLIGGLGKYGGIGAVGGVGGGVGGLGGGNLPSTTTTTP